MSWQPRLSRMSIHINIRMHITTSYVKNIRYRNILSDTAISIFAWGLLLLDWSPASRFWPAALRLVSCTLLLDTRDGEAPGNRRRCLLRLHLHRKPVWAP